MARTAKAVIETQVKDGASAGFRKMQSEMAKTAKQGKVLDRQFRFMRGGIGQVGHQIQDVAVQLQMGQNGLLVLGQQGGQIASIFGPGGAVIGAILAVGSAIAMALLPRLFGASEAMKLVKEESKTLADRFDQLSVAEKAYARLLTSNKIAEIDEELKELEKTERGRLKTVNNNARAVRRFLETEEEHAERLVVLDGRIAILNAQKKELQEKVDGTTKSFTKQERALKDQIATFGKSSRAIKQYRIEQQALNGEIDPSEAIELIALNAHLAQLEKKKAADEKAAKDAKRARDKQFKDQEAAEKKAQRERDKRTQEALRQSEVALQKQEAVAQSFADTLGDGFTKAITGAMTFKDAMKDVARSVVKDLTDMIVKKLITDRVFGLIMDYVNAANFQAPTIDNQQLQNQIDLQFGDPGAGQLPELGNQMPNFDDLPDFHGGGYTGIGARSGGIDSKGGFLSVLHPNETVVDHTKSGRNTATGASNIETNNQSIVVNQTINLTTGIQSTVRAEIQNMMPQINESTKAAVAEARARGGSYSRALVGA